jgi:hypothetical protein
MVALYRPQAGQLVHRGHHQMTAGVQSRMHGAPLRVDPCVRIAARRLTLQRLAEVADDAIDQDRLGDGEDESLAGDRADVARLAAALRVERSAIEHQEGGLALLVDGVDTHLGLEERRLIHVHESGHSSDSFLFRRTPAAERPARSNRGSRTR